MSKIKQMIKKLLSEAPGAGEIGTDQLTQTYMRDTPGQSQIIKTIASLVNKGKVLTPANQKRLKRKGVRRPDVQEIDSKINNRQLVAKKNKYLHRVDVGESVKNKTPESVKAEKTVDKKRSQDGVITIMNKRRAAQEDEKNRLADAQNGAQED